MQTAEVRRGDHATVCRRLDANGNGVKARGRHPALLGGLLRCGACNCAMTLTATAKGAKRYRYYVCSKASKRGRKTCPARRQSGG